MTSLNSGSRRSDESVDPSEFRSVVEDGTLSLYIPTNLDAYISCDEPLTVDNWT